MNSIEMLRRLFAYDRWANRLTFDSLARSPDANERAHRAFVHLIIAEREWLARLEGGRDTAGFDFWPELTLDACASLMDETHAAYERLLDGLDEDGLSRVASYTNSKGVAYRTTFRDVLTHVSYHSAYHRGQVASALRAAGSEPAYTDFVAWQREQEREAGGEGPHGG